MHCVSVLKRSLEREPPNNEMQQTKCVPILQEGVQASLASLKRISQLISVFDGLPDALSVATLSAVYAGQPNGGSEQKARQTMAAAHVRLP